MKKFMYFLVAMAMVSLTSCFGNASNQEASQNEVVEDTIEVVEDVVNDSIECDTTAWFELDENGEPIMTTENDTNQ